MNETAATLSDPYIPIVADLGTERPKIDAERTYLEKIIPMKQSKKNLRNKDVYESYMHKIYNLIVSQTNEQLQ